ncbi:cytochrome c biogenesis protein ResB [Cellulomonas xiejunii]|uniref:Cytochrome c biogenesis protein ResB n=1 Tax=Cellulomonas xiejunii TaxID=2968083 RepID=A0ABY5KMA0_9CELL|nr:cytochrome c biogenesis protein ResB [Cellulomonas xiejunii]MCC2320571.1 cytochrome c biogenesis protein ResB [Cellulomonas xiejunii]UUI70863.1 cytochrome c biogenesis protein ResB [Cellulomonas xiejunii]
MSGDTTPGGVGTGYRPDGLDDPFTDGGEPAPTGRSGLDAQLPALGAVGWLRWAWRQLTSMRVALLLLVLLAVAAVPGTMFPQRPQDPAAVAEYLTEHASTGPWLDRLGFFDVYASVWFSAIYLLLFVSLVGCIVPRARVHAAALRGRPPRTPRRFGRFPAQGAGTSPDAPQAVAERAAAVLRRRRFGVPAFRVDVHDEGAGTWSVSAERGYLRETGNLLFHLALLGLLVAMATGQMLHYRGQAIVVQGTGFANVQASYDTFERGAAFDPADLVPFTMRLDDFEARFDPQTLQSRDFTAHVTVTEPGGEPEQRTVKVNHPTVAGDAKVYLQGNGYAPELTVRDAAGEVAFSGAVPFLPQDDVYTSRGVVKVPDVSGDQPQVGLVGYLLPTAVEPAEGLWRSIDPQPVDPLLVLSVWSGNLGLDTGVPQNVYRLDESRMEQAVDAAGDAVTLYVRPGETVELPDGLGTLTFESLPRFVALDLRHDPSLAWVLTFALLAVGGLMASLFAPRRRLWVRAAPGGTTDEGPGGATTVVTAAGLARGDDLGLQPELDHVLAEVLGARPAVSGDTTEHDTTEHDTTEHDTNVHDTTGPGTTRPGAPQEDRT